LAYTGYAAQKVNNAGQRGIDVRAFMLVPMVLDFTTIAVCAEDARQMTCTGTMIEPNGNSQSPKTVNLNFEPAHKVTLDQGQGAMNVRVVSDNRERGRIGDALLS
jgi:hypothetical protein